jgi:hypothetical protein
MMKKTMKHFLLALVIAFGGSTCVKAQEGSKLDGVKTVYLMPMSNALDQYLAVRLSAKGTLRVVTDPSKADAVFTDHLGEDFEVSLAGLYAGKPSAAKQEADSRDGQAFARVGGGARGRGTTFLVDRKTGTVLWSVYERSKGTAPVEIKKTADRIAAKLAASLSDAGKPVKN